MVSRKIALSCAILAGVWGGVSAAAAPKRYLVKFKSANTFFALSQNVSAMSVLNRNSVQTNQFKLFNMNASVTASLDHVKMLVVESDDALAVQSLKHHPAVALVEEEFFHPAPTPIATRSAGEMEILRGRKMPVPSEPPTVARPPVKHEPIKHVVMDMPWGISAVRAPQAWAITKGKGARVVVLDTGVEMDHPAVHAQIESVQNFTDGTANDVTDEVGHGTHVSGTILADGLNGGLVGVAPQAKLLVGKVCTEQGCSSISITSGIDWATQEKVDVVSMSLGGAFMSQAEAQAVEEAEAAGVMIVAASGNDGKPIVSFPAAAPTALAVGAIDGDSKKADFSNWGPELAVVAPGVDVISSVPRGSGRGSEIQFDLEGKGLGDIKSMPMVGSPISTAGTNNLVFTGLGRLQDFSAVSVRGKFALIARGEIPFKEKVANAINAGAAGILIYNNTSGLMQGTASEDGSEVAIPVVMIEQASGLAAKAQLEAGHSVRASLAVVRTDYASFQGTSMATPHVAGVAALIRAANKSLTPAEVRALLRGTATPLTPNDQNQLGSGLVNAEAAIQRALSSPAVFQMAN